MKMHQRQTCRAVGTSDNAINSTTIRRSENYYIDHDFLLPVIIKQVGFCMWYCLCCFEIMKTALKNNFGTIIKSWPETEYKMCDVNVLFFQ